MGKKKIQFGLTLVEVLVTLAVVSAAAAGAFFLIREQQESAKAIAAAEHISAVAKAASGYVSDNRDAIFLAATPTQPFLIRVADLVDAGQLSGFSASNAYGHSVCVLVLEPTPNRLQALVVAEGGRAVDDSTLGQISAAIGADGGGIYSSNAAVIQGSAAGWAMAPGSYALPNHAGRRCDGSAGVVQFQVGRPVVAIFDPLAAAGAADHVLHREENPARPELGAMNVPLVIESIQTPGESCATTGAVARAADGSLLSCTSGQWAGPGSGANLFWKEAVVDPNQLPECVPSIARQVRSVGVGPPRPYVCTGAAWVPVALDLNGRLSVPGLLQTGGINTTGNATFSGSFNTSGRVVASQLIQLNSTVVLGAACSPEGAISKISTGGVVGCKSGRWARFGFSTNQETSGLVTKTTLPSGLQIAHTSISISTSPSTTVNTLSNSLAVSFPNACLFVMAFSNRTAQAVPHLSSAVPTGSIYSETTGGNVSLIARCFNKDNVVWRMQSIDGQPINLDTAPNNARVSVIAIGY